MNSKLVRDVEDGFVELSYKGKNRGLFEDITVENARWLSGLLSQLSDKQISDAFRAANYSPCRSENLYTRRKKQDRRTFKSVVNGKKLRRDNK